MFNQRFKNQLSRNQLSPRKTESPESICNTRNDLLFSSAGFQEPLDVLKASSPKPNADVCEDDDSDGGVALNDMIYPHTGLASGALLNPVSDHEKVQDRNDSDGDLEDENEYSDNSETDIELFRDYIENAEESSGPMFSFTSQNLDTLDIDLAHRNFHCKVTDVKKQLELMSVSARNEYDDHVTNFAHYSAHKAKKKKKKGDIPYNIAAIEDEELRIKAMNGWSNNREKKRARKEERQTLREANQLGSNLSPGDLAFKYPEAMTIDEIKEEIKIFIQGSLEQLTFPPFHPAGREFIHKIARQLGMKSKSHGTGDARRCVIYKTKNTKGFDVNVFDRVEKRQHIHSKFFTKGSLILPKNVRKGGKRRGKAKSGNENTAKSTIPVAGETVGQGADELGATKGTAKAKALMEKMGWKSGEGLGNRPGGITAPIEHVVRYSRAGLG